jgi:hypothetical protein
MRLSPEVAEIVKAALSVLYERITKIDPSSIKETDGVLLKFIGIPMPEWHEEFKRRVKHLVEGKPVQ